MISRITRLLDSNVSFSTKNHKEIRKYVSFKGKNKPAETVLEKDLMAGLIDKELSERC